MDGVDLMLIYLYTLEPPRISTIANAEQCYLLGDKYALPSLRTAGFQQIFSCIDRDIYRWNSLSEQQKTQWVDFLDRVWTWTMPDSLAIRLAMVHQLSGVGDLVIEYEPFQELLELHPDFNLALMRAMFKATKK